MDDTGNDNRSRARPLEKVEKVQRETYGLAMGQLKSWRDERQNKMMNKESTKQGIAVNKVIGFLNAIAMAVRIQSWFRMVRVRNLYWVILAERKSVKYTYLRAWRIQQKSEKMFRVRSALFPHTFKQTNNNSPTISTDTILVIHTVSLLWKDLSGLERRMAGVKASEKVDL